MEKNNQISENQTVVPTADEILQFLGENGLIDISEVRETITDMNIEKIILESHSHKVWQNQTDQRWYTYINDSETGKRKLISRNSKKKMLEFLNKTSIDEFKKFSELFDEDIYEAISLDTCVRKRLTIGAPGPDAMKKVIDINEKILGELK